MKLLLLHNAYQQHGGEDAVFTAEAELLRANGHCVIRYQRHNDELLRAGLRGSISAGINTLWSSTSYKEVFALLKREEPTIAHFHNTFPLISPSAYYACFDAGVPVVQTLHNYRLLCPAATFLRDGRVCESCLGRSVPWPGIVHACYRNSRAASTVVAGMLTLHRAKQTWAKKVDVYIALSEFSRRKFIEGGLPPKRVAVKPNFVSDPGVNKSLGEYLISVGRVSEEKSIPLLLSAWSKLHRPPPLRIAGDGPLRDELITEIRRRGLEKAIDLLGRIPHEETVKYIRGARFMVIPSQCFENFPLTIAEAFACGVPVIVSRLGAMREIVEDGRTGLHFAAGDSQDLAVKVEWAWAHPEAMSEMGRAARKEYEAKYTPQQNYRNLMTIYQQVLSGASRTGESKLSNRKAGIGVP